MFICTSRSWCQSGRMTEWKGNNRRPLKLCAIVTVVGEFRVDFLTVCSMFRPSRRKLDIFRPSRPKMGLIRTCSTRKMCSTLLEPSNPVRGPRLMLRPDCNMMRSNCNTLQPIQAATECCDRSGSLNWTFCDQNSRFLQEAWDSQSTNMGRAKAEHS